MDKGASDGAEWRIIYANGVELQSPASRRAVHSIAKHGSARWVADHPIIEP